MEVLFVLLLLVVLAVVVAVPIVLVILSFAATRALVRPGGRRFLAGSALAAVLLAFATGLTLTVAFLGSFSDSSCRLVAPDRHESLEGGSIEQRAALWPPGLRCRYTYRSGEVRTYSAGWGPTAVGVIGAGVFGGAMALLVIGGDFATPRACRQPHWLLASFRRP